MGLFRRKKEEHDIENSEIGQESVYEKKQESFDVEKLIEQDSKTDLELESKSEHLNSVSEKRSEEHTSELQSH